ncbi:MAG TPA: response regulator [Spirochaetota bacterium]|nr:response regulator [Spirochaetota bacterium]
MDEKNFVILAIDDDKNVLKLIEKQIQGTGYRLITALSGKEGIEYAKSGNPDLVLLDIMMPNINGFEVLKQLRHDEITSRTPIIMVTSKKEKEDVVRAMRLGVVDYIVKPFSADNLKQKLASALRQGLAARIDDERNTQIVVTRNGGVTFITPRMSLSSKTFLEEARQVFNSSFLRMVAKDRVVVDLRALPEFSENDIKPLEAIIALLAPMKLNVIAGKHYGDVITLTDIDDRHNLFITEGDFEVFLAK